MVSGRILLSIKHEYASEIVAGRKRFDPAPAGGRFLEVYCELVEEAKV